MPKHKSGWSGKNAGNEVYAQNAVKTLVANLRFASVDNPIRSVTVTSSVPNEGKSTIALALARSLATGGSSVLLIDGDMRRRSLGAMMQLHTRNGIYAVLSGKVALNQAVVPTDTGGLYFLDCEPHIPNPVDVFSSQRFKALLDELYDAYDYVVVDTPPLSTFVDAAVVGSLADATLLVVRQDYTRRDDVLGAYDQLQKAGANVVGTVLNFCESEKDEYYYSYYRKDGTRVR